MFLGSRVLPVPAADNLTADCLRQCGIIISQPYKPPWPVTAIALLFTSLFLISKIIMLKGAYGGDKVNRAMEAYSVVSC
jgi:hypothetical protein